MYGTDSRCRHYGTYGTSVILCSYSLCYSLLSCSISLYSDCSKHAAASAAASESAEIVLMRVSVSAVQICVAHLRSETEFLLAFAIF